MDIKEWFDRLINLDRNWKKSRKEEERMRERKETLALRLNILANTRPLMHDVPPLLILK